MRSEGNSNRSVCLSVSLSRIILALSYERYQQLQCYKGMKNNVAILLKQLLHVSRDNYGVKTSEKANMHHQHWLTSNRFSPFSAPQTN